MAIDLPRNPRALYFTGSVKALAPEPPANALGRQRPHAPPPPPPSRAPVQAMPPPPSLPPPSLPPPSMFPRSMQAKPPSRGLTTPTRLTTMRGPRDPLASMDEDILTEALDRDEINAALFPVARRENAHKPSPNLPVPGFRSVEAARAQQVTPRIVRAQPNGGSLPLGVWLMAALVAGILSFHFAPEARASVESAVRAVSSSP